jgi:uncharacterized membrane protein
MIISCIIKEKAMLVKTTTYGTMHMIVAIAVAYAISGSWQVALGIGIIEPLVQTVFYNVHEHLWTTPTKA